MPNLQYDVEMEIVAPYMTARGIPALLLNQVFLDRYLYRVLEDGYQIVPGKFRSVTDSISQADGSSLQLPFIDGMVATIDVLFTVCENGDPSSAEPACDTDLRVMNEMLMGTLNSLREWTADPNVGQRYTWTPSGTSGVKRMLTNVLLASWPVPKVSSRQFGQTFTLATPLPYAIADDEVTTTITAGTSAAVTNNGNASYSPAILVDGPTSAFTITDEATGLEISYDSTRPGAVAIGGGDYAEIDTFKGTIFLNGDGADLVAGLDPTVTEMFPVVPGAQTVAVTGADVSFIVNGAYV